MRLVMCIKNIINNPKRKVAELLPQLRQLRTDLYTFIDPVPLDGIVNFFSIISPWHDREDEIDQIVTDLQAVNYGQHSELIQKLEMLRKHFQNAGRNRYGWNRTEKGESVTADKVFLGNIFGLFTHSVSFWKQQKGQPKDEWKGGIWEGHPRVAGKNAYDVVSEQARGFMASHRRAIIDIISWLDRNVERVS